MKRIYTLLLCVAAALAAVMPASAASHRGEKFFGPRIGFVDRNESALVGLEFRYTLGAHLRIAPSVDMIFRHRDMDGLNINLDLHFPYDLAGTRCDLYPLIGLSYTSWGLHDRTDIDGKDVTTHRNCLGANFGAGFDWRATSTLTLGFQARYNLMRHYPTAVFALSIGYVF